MATSSVCYGCFRVSIGEVFGEEAVLRLGRVIGMRGQTLQCLANDHGLWGMSIEHRPGLRRGSCLYRTPARSSARKLSLSNTGQVFGEEAVSEEKIDAAIDHLDTLYLIREDLNCPGARCVIWAGR